MACVCENVDVGVGNITHFPTNYLTVSGRLRASLTVGQIWQVGLTLQPSSYDVKAVAQVWSKKQGSLWFNHLARR